MGRVSQCSRLLVLSNKVKGCHLVSKVIRSDVEVVLYQHDNLSLDELSGVISKQLMEKKVTSVAFMLYGTENAIYLTSDEVLSRKTIFEDVKIRRFFKYVARNHVDFHARGCRMDFLSAKLATQKDGDIILQELQSLLTIPVGMSKDLYGVDLYSDVDGTRTKISKLYFDFNKMQDMQRLDSSDLNTPNMSGYEKIRIVGKGAFGTAVLYRKKDDDSLVVLKEVNMHDLNAAERQLAMNEIKVLSMLDHPNIVSYFDSFEDDGLLMIEMEYADGGTLAQYLSQRKQPMEEKEILMLFQQICSALQHMHEHNILHRDLKTANIFLTKDGIVKVGDFGISKMLTTRQGGAHTVLGTPYYISPEMCQGKTYNDKSDIWALGCILYEMACLQKTFEGTNLPALVNKIMKGQFAPVKGNYTPHYKKLVHDLLQKEPDFRPTSNDLMFSRLPELMSQYNEPGSDIDDELITSTGLPRNKSTLIKSTSSYEPRSVLYHLTTYECDISLSPISLPPRSRIREVSISSTHIIVLTTEQQVYTWGSGNCGQLGHESLEEWQDKPRCVESLKGKSITRVAAGKGFSVFASDNGIVMTCGDGSSGCLGHGDWHSSPRPKLVEKLLSVDVSGVSCGPRHVVVVSGDGEVYSWGCGTYGCLGLGDEQDRCSPVKLNIPDGRKIRKVKCGPDGTMMITNTGLVLACGRNDYNKLGLNERKGFLMQMKNLVTKNEIEAKFVPSRIARVPARVFDMSLGPTHSALLVEPGNLFMLGDNSFSQFGIGNTRSSYASPQQVKLMNDKTVCMVQCGDTYTIAGTIENALYFWGSRHYGEVNFIPFACSDESRPSKFSRDISTNSKERGRRGNDSFDSVEDIQIGANKSSLMQEIEKNGPDSTIMTVNAPHVKQQCVSQNGDVRRSDGKNSSRRSTDVILKPQEILALYASPSQVAKGEVVNLARIQCHIRNAYVVVDTTAPLPPAAIRKKSDDGSLDNNYNAHDRNEVATDDQSLVNLRQNGSNGRDKLYAEADSFGPIPTWLKNEVTEAENATKIPKRDGSQRMQMKANNRVQHHGWEKVRTNHYYPEDEDDYLLLPGSASSDATSSGHSSIISEEYELKNELEKVSKEKELIKIQLEKMQKKLNDTEKRHDSFTNTREKELAAEIDRLTKKLSANDKSDAVVVSSPAKKSSVQGQRDTKICNVQ
ncbi:Uncharacterised protein g6493 [Pycnogonum litorale]